MGLLAVLSLYCVGALAIEGLRFDFPVFVSFFYRLTNSSQVPQLSIPQAGSASLGVDFNWGPTHTSDTARPTSVTATNTAIITANTATVTIDGNAHNPILATVEGSGKTGSFAYPASITTMSWHPALSSLAGIASGIQYMPTGNINMSPKYPNSSVSDATGVFWSGFGTHSLVPGTGMNPGFKSTVSGGSMILSTITSHEIATSAVQSVAPSGQFSPTSPKSSSGATRAATTASGISPTLTPSSNSSAGASQITFKGVGESLHLSMTSCVLAVILGLVCGL